MKFLPLNVYHPFIPHLGKHIIKNYSFNVPEITLDVIQLIFKRVHKLSLKIVHCHQRGENLPASAAGLRDTRSIPGSGRSPGGGHGSPLQCSRLENPVGRGAWRGAVHRVAGSRIQLKRLSTSKLLKSAQLTIGGSL